MNHFARLVCFAVLLLARAGHGQEAKIAEPLALVPPKSVVVIQVNGIERMQERLHALLKQAAPDKADDVAKQVRGWLADTLGGRDLKALRPDGRVLVAFSDLEKLPDDITVSFLFPATNADEFRKRFLTEEERKSLKKEGDLESVQWEDRPGRYYLVNLAGYVAVCSDKEAARIYAKGELKGVAEHLSTECTHTFLDSDLAVFVNVKALNVRYGEQLKRYKSVIELFLKGDTIAGVSKSQIDQIRGMIGAAFRVLEDGSAAVIGITLQPDGVRIKAIAQFGTKTPTAATLSKSRPGALTQLGTLPAGQVSYSASALGQIAPQAAELILGSFAAGDEDLAARATIDRSLRELASLDRGLTLSAGRILASGGLEIAVTNDADKIVAGRLAVLKALTKTGTFASVPLKAKPEVTEKAEQIGDFSFHGAHLTFDLDKAVADLPDEVKESTKASFKRAVGDEMRIWLGSNGEQVIQVIAKDWAEAKGLITAYRGGLGRLSANEAFQSTRKQLPAAANMLVVLDAARSADALLGAFRYARTPPAAAARPVGKPAYIGVALILKENHAAIEMFIPAAAIDRVRTLLEPLLDRKD